MQILNENYIFYTNLVMFTANRANLIYVLKSICKRNTKYILPSIVVNKRTSPSHRILIGWLKNRISIHVNNSLHCVFLLKYPTSILYIIAFANTGGSIAVYVIDMCIGNWRIWRNDNNTLIKDIYM